MLACLQGGYQVRGSRDEFPSLAELIEFYTSNALSDEDNDMLGEPLELIHDLHLGYGDQEGTVWGGRRAGCQ